MRGKFSLEIIPSLISTVSRSAVVIMALSGCLPFSRPTATATPAPLVLTETLSSPMPTIALQFPTPTAAPPAIVSERIAYISKFAFGSSGNYPGLNLISIRCASLLKGCSNQLVHLADEADDTSSPAWSPDGKTIDFVSFGYTETPLPQIYVINADGSGRRRLTHMPSSMRPASYYGAVWSRDASRIAFINWGKGVYVMNRDGSGLTALGFADKLLFRFANTQQSLIRCKLGTHRIRSAMPN